MKTAAVFIISLLALLRCASTKPSSEITGRTSNAVEIAIQDFVKSSKLAKTNNAFSIGIDSINNDILGVSITPSNAEILINKEIIAGTFGPTPSQYREVDNKLFYWQDYKYPLTDDALKMYEQYNLIDYDSTGLQVLPEFTIDDSQRGAHYYFCRDNYLVYKKVTTNIAMGYYDTPKLDCSK